MQKEPITINNVSQTEPELLYAIISQAYDGIRLPGMIRTVDDLNYIADVIVQCTNIKTYLNSLMVWLDIETRREKRKGKENKDAYDKMICRKNIISCYYDTINDISKAGSRLITVYMEARKEMEAEKKTGYRGKTREY